MPGIYGFYGELAPAQREQLLAGMGSALEGEARFFNDSYHSDLIGLGRKSLRITSPEPQPIWNPGKSACIVFEGELYGNEALKRKVQNGGQAAACTSDAQLVLCLYDLLGEDFANELNGAFALAIWDAQARKLLVANDRLGLYPLFYASYNGRVTFSSGVRALLADAELPRRPNHLGIAEFLTFDHALHDHTFLESAHLLVQGSLLTVQDGVMKTRQYHRIAYPQTYELRNESDYIDELNAVLERAVARQAGNQHPLGVLLSGGLDSRFLIALLADANTQAQLHAFTFGSADCDDVRYAREVAGHTRAAHHYYELDKDYLLRFAEQAVRITDGLGNVVNLHAIANLEEELQHANIIYKGFLADAMMGYALMHQHWATYDEKTQWQAHLAVHTRQGVITFNEAERAQLYTPAFTSQMQTTILDSYRTGMLDSGSDSLAIQRLHFDYYQRVPRMTIHGVQVVRSRAFVRLPFADNEFVDFSLRVPPGLLYGRGLIKNAFIKKYPKLAQIPTTETGYPMVHCSRDVMLRVGELIEWHLTNRGLGKLVRKRARHYANYSEWFRTNLRSWVEDTLLSKRALERGYFNPDYVRKIVADHMAGANNAIRLGAFLSVELWHRLYLD